MALRENPTASPATLGDVLSNGKRYVMPMFQRDYAWDETEWADLWSDIVAIAQEGEGAHHFLGALVLQPSRDDATLNIIDGQQRLVTLSVLALAVITRIEQLPAAEPERSDNRDRARLLRERFVSTKDPSSLQHHSRLKLNASDNGFYQTYLVQGQRPARPRALKGPEGRLNRCFEYFEKQLETHPGAGTDGAGLALFLNHVLANRLRFIEIRVENDETAFSVFETLNARGVALGTSDLVKNYLFANAARGGAGDLEQARLHWDRLMRAIPAEKVASLLFHKLTGEVRGLRERRVFVEVKRLVPMDDPSARAAPDEARRGRTVFQFLRALESAAEIYTALDEPTDDFWQQYAPQAKRWVRVLSTLRAEQYKPVALAAFDRFADRPEKLSRLVEILAVLSVRATIAKVNTGDLQRAYQEVAYRIGQGELKSPAAIGRALAGVTPADDEFRSAFETLELDPKGHRKRLLRYVLVELERASGGQSMDLDAADFTVEHILPENPGEGWGAFSFEERARDVVRVGNLTPLESGLNRAVGAAGFERKREVYAQSRYALTRGIAGEEWTPEALRARQAAMAELAVGIWRVPLEEG